MVIEALARGPAAAATNRSRQLPPRRARPGRRRGASRSGTSAADREKRSRTVFAQEGIKPDEVAAELAEVRAALGTAQRRRSASSIDVLSPVRRPRHRRRPGPHRPRRDASLACATRSAATGVVTARFEPPVADVEELLARTHPLVAGLAAHVLDTALDPLRDGPAARCGVIRTTAVSTRTTLFVVPLPLPPPRRRRRRARQLLAEDAAVVAFTGDPAEPGVARRGRGRRAARRRAGRQRRARAGGRDARRRARRRGPAGVPTSTDFARRAGRAVCCDAHRRVRRAGRRRRRPRPRSSRGSPSTCSASTCSCPARGALMARTRTTTFTTIRTEGGLLPADLLARVAANDRTVPGVQRRGLPPRPASGSTRRSPAPGTGCRRLEGVRPGARPRCRPATTATTLTRERWLLPLFEELGLRPPADGQGGRGRRQARYPISHVWGHDADPPRRRSASTSTAARRACAGAAGVSPHGLVQELLNRSDEHLWGIVTNGLRLRVLRDNASLTRQAFVEFDLEAMFDGEVFADFVAALADAATRPASRATDPSRVLAGALDGRGRRVGHAGPRPAARRRRGGDRARSAPASSPTRPTPSCATALRAGELTAERLLPPAAAPRLPAAVPVRRRGPRPAPRPAAADDEPAQRYRRFYSLGRLRTLAERRRGTPARRPVARPRRGVRRPRPARRPAGPRPARPRQLPVVAGGLPRPRPRRARQPPPARRRPPPRLRRGPRRAGRCGASTTATSAPRSSARSTSRCSSCTPTSNVDAGTFALGTAAGNERKTTGSYYTPTSLITVLLDSALDPVLDEAVRKPDPEAALLDLKVLDPACGSGHFLIAAAHRIAKRLASVRTGDDEPAPDAVRAALRDVIGRCIYGVDVNPMAVELCKVSLWMEAMEPGKPLGFLDHRIVLRQRPARRHPGLLAGGIPDDAFKPLDGDDKKVVAALKKRNQAERSRPGDPVRLRHRRRRAAGLVQGGRRDRRHCPRRRSPAVEAKAARWGELLASPELPRRRPRRRRLVRRLRRPQGRRRRRRSPTTRIDAAVEHPDRVDRACSRDGRRQRLDRVRLPALAPRLPRRLPRRRPRRLRRRARQPAVGEGQALGEGVLRRPRSRDRRRSPAPSARRRSPSWRSRTPTVGRVPDCAPPRRRREPPPAQLGPVPALRPRRRQHLRRVRRSDARRRRAHRPTRCHRPDRHRHRRHHQALLRRLRDDRAGWSACSRLRERSATSSRASTTPSSSAC